MSTKRKGHTTRGATSHKFKSKGKYKMPNAELEKWVEQCWLPPPEYINHEGIKRPNHTQITLLLFKAGALPYSKNKLK